MRMFLISNGIWEYDGRLRELVNIAKLMGSTKGVFRSIKKDETFGMFKIVNGNYFKFIIKSVVLGLKEKDIDVYFIDNRKAVIPGLILSIIRKKKIIQDVRELYLYDEQKNISNRIGTFFERILMRKADVVISANEFRAKYMYENFKLKRYPIVFENIRQLNKQNDESKFKDKYSHFFDDSDFVVLSTSGTDVSRTNDKLAEAIVSLGEGFKVIFVGKSSDEDNQKIKGIFKSTDQSKVLILDSVPQEELSYLISKSDVGVVNYHSEDLNNKYCASGKLYEFIFEGKPIVTTENPPLIKLTNDFNIGISDNNYALALTNLKENYPFYKTNVETHRKSINIDEINGKIVSEILNLIKSK